jgi:hypothetical protein
MLRRLDIFRAKDKKRRKKRSVKNGLFLSTDLSHEF